MRTAINGILLLDKPLHISSNGILQRVKRLFNAKKAGHTGSLDPLATGMLPICLGEATKFSQHLLDADKTYHVIAKLGAATTTGDAEGEVVETSDYKHVTLAQIKTVIQQFLGPIQQIPPMYSALKHQGQPLYRLARKGEIIERPARQVTILAIEILEFTDDLLTMAVTCSKGTYIRTLVEDITTQLGCKGHVTALRRTSIANFVNAKMYTLEELAALNNESLNALLLPMEAAVNSLPAMQIEDEAVLSLFQGKKVQTPHLTQAPLVRLMTPDHQFIGLATPLTDGWLKPLRLIANTAKAKGINS